MTLRNDCPYLGTIEPKNLDFDVPFYCSISLSTQSVYACLVCGKFFKGRGPQSYAYYHSMDHDHNVYVNLSSLKFYCLPDNYEISTEGQPLLNAVKDNIYPTVKKALEYSATDKQPHKEDAFGSSYYVGYLGVTSSASTSSTTSPSSVFRKQEMLAAVVHCLTHFKPLRDFLLQTKRNEFSFNAPLLNELALVTKKMWNDTEVFKSFISPHTLENEIEKRKKTESFSSFLQFYSWILNQINDELKKNNCLVLESNLRGRLKVYERDLDALKPGHEDKAVTITNEVGYLFLSLDLPVVPVLTKSKKRSNVMEVPQVHLLELLKKYDGETATVNNGKERKYIIQAFPEYLVFAFDR